MNQPWFVSNPSHVPMPGRVTTMMALTVLCALAALLPAGCSRNRMPVASVPVQKTAAEQYRYALDFREGKSVRFITDKKKLASAREVVRQVFAKVPENFPQDRVFTPLARLEIVEMEAGLDSNHAEVTHSDIHRAIKDLQQLIEQYPEHPFVQAKALYDRGLCHKRLGEYNEAKDAFKQCMDQYLKSTNKEIENIARRAAYFYNETNVRE